MVAVMLYCGIVIDNLTLPWFDRMSLGWFGYLLFVADD
uniref:Uncharacterized protein n=1 Tax=uncultured bacterium B19D1_C12D4_E9D6 TaxID=1329637 RepID=S4W9V3_9BACT|nr:hypothetical protein [uncultured bacterium B19D1_C12D4_E9D6]